MLERATSHIHPAVCLVLEAYNTFPSRIRFIVEPPLDLHKEIIWWCPDVYSAKPDKAFESVLEGLNFKAQYIFLLLARLSYYLSRAPA